MKKALLNLTSVSSRAAQTARDLASANRFRVRASVYVRSSASFRDSAHCNCEVPRRASPASG